jgi:hypothetical protein
MSADDRTIQPMRERPGRPVASGFTLLPPAEQERERERWAEVQARTATFREEAHLCRVRAMAAARTAVIR